MPPFVISIISKIFVTHCIKLAQAVAKNEMNRNITNTNYITLLYHIIIIIIIPGPANAYKFTFYVTKSSVPV